MYDGVTRSYNLQTCHRGRYTNDLSPTATQQSNTNPPSKSLAAAAAAGQFTFCLAGDKGGERKEGIRFAHCRFLIMARRASCTRSSGTRHGFLPSILEKVAAPSQHRHQRQCTAAPLHRCIVASSLYHSTSFVLVLCKRQLLTLNSDPPACPICAVAPQQLVHHRAAQGAELESLLGGQEESHAIIADRALP